MRKALVVGINRYPNLKNPQGIAQHLTYPAADAEAVARLLRECGLFEVTLLPETCPDYANQVDEKGIVNKEKLQREISKLFNPEDGDFPTTALLFFAGHGLQETLPRNKVKGYLATSDADNKRIYGVPFDWLVEELIDSPVKEQIVWLDCCHSGEFTNLPFAQADAENQSRSKVNFNVSRLFIAACRESETAHGGIKGHGLLTYLLLQGLNPYQNYNEAWTTSTSLNDFVHTELRRDTVLSTFQQRFRSNCYGEQINFWQKLGQETRRGASPPSAGEPISSSSQNLFSALIADKTKDFVGREYVFDAIAQFISTQPNGYFIIIGDPGQGKSAILAKYIQDTGCIAHFNVRSEGITRADQFLDNICTKLIKTYKLNYRLPLNVTSDGNFLRSLLEEVSDKLNSGERLVIAIDALDEVDLISQTSGANILYLPRSLPKGVYFILTRRDVTLPLRVDPPTPQLPFDLRNYGEQSLKDVQTYIRQRVAESQFLQNWIVSRQLTGEKFITKIAIKSANNFMYLCYVLGDIERGAYEDFSMESLPQGLEGYYEEHWECMKLNEQPPPRGKLKIVYVLAEARQPVTGRVIAQQSAEDELMVQQVLQSWRQFLREQRHNRPTSYSIYHNSFRDFLYNKDIVRIAGGQSDGE